MFLVVTTIRKLLTGFLSDFEGGRLPLRLHVL